MTPGLWYFLGGMGVGVVLFVTGLWVGYAWGLAEVRDLDKADARMAARRRP